MAQDLLTPKKFWEEEDSQGIDLLAQEQPKKETPIGDRLKAGFKQSFAGAGNTADIALSLAASLPAGLFQGKQAQEDIYKNLNERIASRQQWAGKEDPGFLGKLFGVGTTLPMQMLNMGWSPTETGKTFLDEGESLGRALGATSIDALGNVAGIIVPGAVGTSRLAKVASGAGINAGQDALTRSLISSIAEKQSTKEKVGPSWENATLAGIVGGGFGAIAKPNKKKEVGPSRISGKLDEVVASSETPRSNRIDLLLEEGETPPVIRVGKDGEAYPATFENEVARAAAEQRMLQQLDQEYADPMNRMVRELAPTEEPKAPIQPVDAIEQMRQQLEQDIYSPEMKAAEQDIAWKQREQEVSAEQIAQRDLETKQEAQEGPLQALEETLREQAYKPTGDGQGPKTRAFKSTRFGQGGSAPMLNDLAEGIVKLGAGLRGRFTGVKPPEPDTIETPRSAENITAKNEKARKARAIGINDSVYSNPKTLEEVVANPGKDIGPIQDFASGVEGVIRRNSSNNALKYIRYLRTQAQLATDALTRKHITGPEGYNKKLTALSEQEKIEVHELIQDLSKKQIDYSDDIGTRLGLTDAQKAFMDVRVNALNAALDTANTVNQKLGFEEIGKRSGYSPGMFSSTYTALAGRYEIRNGKKVWVTDGVANANSKWEYDQAKKYFQDKGMELIELPRKGLKQDTKVGRTFDGTMNLLSALAEFDPRFADAKAELDSFLKNQTKNLYNFNVHELKKKGVEGNIGNKPWLDAKQNAKENLEAEVNYLDEAFKYWNYQEVLNKTKQLVDDPALANQPNTRKYLDKYVKQLTGNNLHPVGAAINSLVDMGFKAAGQSAAKVGLEVGENPNKVMAGARELGSALMMNIYAPAFAGVQLIQMFQGGLPEAFKIANESGLSTASALDSMQKGMLYRGLIPALETMGWLDKTKLPKEILEDYHWMREHAMDHYNEAQMSHEASQNPKWTQTKNATFWPTRIPEMITRPMVFLWYSDLFRKAGLSGEELHVTAKNATDYAMVNYHPDERPMVYQELGVAGQGVGALRTYSHNQLEQMITRTKEAKQNPQAFMAMTAFAVALMGVAGLPFYNELDELVVQPLTGKSARSWLDDVLHPALLDGAASAYTGLDYQTRFSMADMVPGNAAEAIAGPQLTKMADIAGGVYDYIKNQDIQSFNELAKAAIPTGMYGAYEQANLVDKEGYVLDKEGQRKYSQPRTEREQAIRKYSGIRPLRERVEDSELYADRKSFKKLTDKQREAANRMKASLNLKDMEGFESAMQSYLDNQGDPKNIQSIIKKGQEMQALSARQRASGMPSNSVGSVNKYKHFWEE